MPDAPDFIEAGFTTPAAFEASKLATTATTTAAPTQVTSDSGGSGVDALSALSQGAAAAGGSDPINLTTRAPLEQPASRSGGGISASAAALFPLGATLLIVAYIWWRRRQ